MQTITAAGRATQLRHLPGPGPTLLLLHGASGTGASWEAIAAHWSWADLWIPDLPGRGVPAAGLDSVSSLAGWLSEVVAYTGAAVVVGHSLGGAIGLQLSLDEPQALKGLVMVASSARLRVSPAILEAVAQSSEERPLDLGFAFGPGTDKGVIAAYRGQTMGVPAQAALADWRACDAFDVRARLAESQTPTLVAYGDADVLTPPKHQRGLVEALPEASELALAGGHMLPWEQPLALSEGVRGWLL